MPQKRLWNIVKMRMLEDRGALPKVEAGLHQRGQPKKKKAKVGNERRKREEGERFELNIKRVFRGCFLCLFQSGESFEVFSDLEVGMLGVSVTCLSVFSFVRLDCVS